MENIIQQIKDVSEACIAVNENCNNQNLIIKVFNDTIDFVCEHNDVPEDIVFNHKVKLPRCKWFADDTCFYGYTNHVIIVIDKQTYEFKDILSHYDDTKDFVNIRHYSKNDVELITLSKTDKENINKTLTVVKNKELLLREITNNIDDCNYHNYEMRCAFKLV